MTKIQIRLQTAGDCPPIQHNNFKSSEGLSVTKLIDVVRKDLSLPVTQSVFLFYKEFAIYPDMTIGDIAQHTPGATSLDIFYSLSQPYG